jgi:hypothetical protein
MQVKFKSIISLYNNVKIIVFKSLTSISGEFHIIPKVKVFEKDAELLAYPLNVQGEIYYIFSLVSLKLLKERSERLGLSELAMRINVLTRDTIERGTCICDNEVSITVMGVKLHERIPLTDSEIFFYGPESAIEKKKEEVLSSIKYLKKVLKLEEWEHVTIVGNEIFSDCKELELPPLTLFQLYVNDEFNLDDKSFKVLLS